VTVGATQDPVAEDCYQFSSVTLCGKENKMG